MLLRISVLLFLNYSFAFGQSYQALISAANNHYSSKEYRKSVSEYKKAFKIEQNNPVDLYNAGCSAALSGDKKLAFVWLSLALKKGWTNVKHLESDTDLSSLKSSKKWEKLVTEMQIALDKKEANYDKSLQAMLLEIFNNDQEIRHQLDKAQKDFGMQSKQVDSLVKIMQFKDSMNLIKITDIIDKHGWVGADKVGGQASQTLFFVIQHADLKTQQKYLPIMREAVRNKKANSFDLALLEDRVAIGEGRRQTYGSQIGWDHETQKHFIFPLDDPDNVDKRRGSVGLGLFADYLKFWDLAWNAEEYKKLLPALEEKLAKQK